MIGMPEILRRPPTGCEVVETPSQIVLVMEARSLDLAPGVGFREFKGLGFRGLGVYKGLGFRV